MAIEIGVGPKDDPLFMGMLNQLVRAFIAKYPSEELWIIQVENWFDHKWLEFSGKNLVGVWSDKLTFPPFSPSRILSQNSYLRKEDSYLETPLKYLPHNSKKIPSQANLQRRIQRFTVSSSFFWYSSNTLSNTRGSVMAYSIADKKASTWFAGFSREDGWKLQALKGISKRDFDELMGPVTIREL